MEFKSIIRMYRTGTERKKTTVDLYVPIADALDYLKNVTGMTNNDLINEILDQYLTEAAKRGEIPKPTKEETKEETKVS